ncbi:MAG: DUF3576 domain-containing protein [Alphaproteobacteria bacterium]
MNKIFASLMLLLLVSCSAKKDDSLRVPKTVRERREAKIEGLLFDEPIYESTKSKKNATKGIGVNTYLWKASLEATSFLPKKSVDPFGGTILTNWYIPTETPKERLKVEVIITGRELKSDALKVSIFRQKQDKFNKWKDQVVNAKTVDQFEDTILTRARELKIAEEK